MNSVLVISCYRARKVLGAKTLQKLKKLRPTMILIEHRFPVSYRWNSTFSIDNQETPLPRNLEKLCLKHLNMPFKMHSNSDKDAEMCI